MYKHYASGAERDGRMDGWSDKEIERKERKAGDGGKPVCMLTKTQKAV